MCEYWNFHTQLVKVKISTITLESNLKTSNKTKKCKLYIYKLYYMHIKITQWSLWHCL